MATDTGTGPWGKKIRQISKVSVIKPSGKNPVDQEIGEISTLLDSEGDYQSQEALVFHCGQEWPGFGISEIKQYLGLLE